MSQDQVESWWYRTRSMVLNEVARRLGLKAKNVLEIGPGSGPNRALWSDSRNTTLLEIDPAISAELQESFPSAEVINASWPEGKELLTRRYSLVIAADVLEHIDEESEAIRGLASVLNPGGQVILTVPAYSWMWSAHDVEVGHVRRYTRTSLKRAMEKGGLKVIYSSYFISLSLPLAVAQRFGQKLLRKSPGGQAGLRPPRLINEILVRLGIIEAWWVAKSSFPFGLTVLAVAQRDGD